MDEEQRKMAEELLFAEERAPSFCKQLYFGKIDNGELFPYPALSDGEESKTKLFLKELESYLEKELDPDRIDREASIPSEVIEGLGKLGALGMTVPVEYGGLGMSQNGYCRAIERIAARCGGTAVFTNAHQSIGLKGLLLFGTEEQKRRWLPSLAKGETVAAFSLTEPNAGSDAGGIETKALYDKEKRVYRINGKKQWTTNGSIAGLLTLMAKTEVETAGGVEEKVTAFLVTPEMKGFHIEEPALEKVGIRGTRTTNFRFEDLEVPEENILGPKGGGLRVCLTCLDYGRTTFGAMCTGGAKYCVKRAAAHAVSRYQFKRPLASFSLVKEKLAKMSALAYAMDATTYMTAGFIDRGVEDVMLESAILKVFASEALWEILYDAMQIFGGRSFFTTEPFERMMRDARLNMIGEGSNEVLRAFIGAVGMRDVGMQLKGQIDSLKKPGGVKALFSAAFEAVSRLKLPSIALHSQLLAGERRAFARCVRNFGIDVVKLLARHREEVIEEQLQLNRMASSAISLFTAAAVLSKLSSAIELSRGGEGSLSSDLAIGKHYCRIAFSAIERNREAMRNNFDGEIERVSKRITGI